MAFSVVHWELHPTMLQLKFRRWSAFAFVAWQVPIDKTRHPSAVVDTFSSCYISNQSRSRWFQHPSGRLAVGAEPPAQFWGQKWFPSAAAIVPSRSWTLSSSVYWKSSFCRSFRSSLCTNCLGQLFQHPGSIKKQEVSAIHVFSILLTFTQAWSSTYTKSSRRS